MAALGSAVLTSHFISVSFLTVHSSSVLLSTCIINVFSFFSHPGDQSKTLLNTHSPCWAVFRASHSGWVSEYLLVFDSYTGHVIVYAHPIYISLLFSSSFSLHRGSYAKGLPQIRIDRDLEENSFFWRKGSETDLWMSYPKINSTTWQT